MSIPRSRDLWWLAALLLAAPLVPAQDDAAQQRVRIDRERAQVELRSRQAEAACERRFAVSACLAEARAERRAALHQLDQQRALLDDVQRKQRAADRQARIQQRQEEQARADEQRQPPAPGRASTPPTKGTASPSGVDKADAPVRRARPAADAQREQAQADKRAAAAQRRAAQATEHRAAVERRNAQRAAQKAPSPPLPVPSAPQAASSVRP